MGFYDNFLKLCELNRVAPSVVAREIGLNNSSATYWKRGSVPKYSTIKKLADYFSVDWTELLPEDEQADAIINHIKEKLGPIRSQTFTYEQQCEIHEANTRNRFEAAYARLNLVGHQKVADYAEKLTKDSRYLVDPKSPYHYQAQQAPQPSLDSAEGKDTTQPPEGSEGPQEGG